MAGLGLTRRQLQAFLGNDFDAIRKMEILLETVSPLVPNGVDALDSASGTAGAIANSAMGEIQDAIPSLSLVASSANAAANSAMSELQDAVPAAYLVASSADAKSTAALASIQEMQHVLALLMNRISDLEGQPQSPAASNVIPRVSELPDVYATSLADHDVFQWDSTLQRFLNTGILAGLKYGGTSANYSEFEADGTLKFVGSATVFDDLMFVARPKSTGAGKPTLATFTGNIYKYKMAVNDICDFDDSECLHDWMEGTPIEIHVHWITGGLNDATVRGVKWEIGYTWANIESAGGTIVYAGATTLSAETSIAANEPDKTHKYTSVTTFTPVGGKIGAGLSISLKRIASVTNTAPAADPWISMVGVHYQKDTCGSRTNSTK